MTSKLSQKNVGHNKYGPKTGPLDKWCPG